MSERPDEKKENIDLVIKEIIRCHGSIENLFKTFENEFDEHLALDGIRLIIEHLCEKKELQMCYAEIKILANRVYKKLREDMKKTNKNENEMICKECYWSHVDYLKCNQKGKCNYFIYFRLNTRQKIIMVEKAWIMLYKKYISTEQFIDVIEAIVHGGQNELKWNIIKLALSELKQQKREMYVVLIRTIPNAMNPNSWIRGAYSTYEIAKEKAFEGWKGTITMRHEKNLINTFGFSTFYFDLKALDDVLPYIIEIRKCEVDL